ncbi:MAG: ATP-binding protein [Actinomycetota bacterium]
MPRTFSFKLGAAFAGIGIAAAALTAILVNVAFGSRFTGYLDSQRAARTEQLVDALADSYDRSDGWDTSDLEKLAPLALMDGGTLRLEDTSGSRVWEASSAALGDHYATAHRAMMNSGALGPERRLAISVDGKGVGVAWVRIPEPGVLPADVSFRSAVNRLLLYGGIAAGLAALLLGIVLARRATAPARALTGAARALASGDRAQRVDYQAADEFGEMAQTFNLMADTIEEEDRLRRVFASDVAHELRTPLAILRSEIEALQDGVRTSTPAALGSLHEETLRLTRLVGDLETLARADAAGFSLERAPTDLATLARETVAEFEPFFGDRGIRIEARLEAAPAEADPVRMRQVISNLLSNALKFSPDGGRLTVETTQDGAWSVLRVADEGHGIPADEIARVFDRFFRGTGARGTGSGIGLTVVRELARAHGGDASVSNEAGRGAAFAVRIPSSAPRAVHTVSSSRDATVGSNEGRT